MKYKNVFIGNLAENMQTLARAQIERYGSRLVKNFRKFIFTS